VDNLSRAIATAPSRFLPSTTLAQHLMEQTRPSALVAIHDLTTGSRK
jgi:hypothetical protein